MIQWVYVQNTIKYYTRRFRFFVSKLAKLFCYDINWYKKEEAFLISNEYLRVLDQIITVHSGVKLRLKRCKRCSILFITHPCNINRNDLCCPFGCREIRKKENNNKRSKNYYHRHPERKKIQNQKRYLKKTQKNKITKNKKEDSIEVDEGVFISNKIYRYICMLIKTIESNKISNEQILDRLRKKWRQHRLEYQKNYCKVPDD